MRDPHHHAPGGAGPRHHLDLQVAAVHGLEIGHDRDGREALVQRAYAVQSLGQDQRCSGFQPIDAGGDGDLGHMERLTNRGEIQRYLHAWLV